MATTRSDPASPRPPASVTTWNINSVRLRAPIVQDLLRRDLPDVLCLQEIKCQTHEFPHEAFAELGYVHAAVNGFKGYHGVAILSRHPFERVRTRASSAARRTGATSRSASMPTPSTGWPG